MRQARPFEPFRLLVADGRQYDVRYPENFTMTGNGRLIAIARPDHFATLVLLLVTGVQRPIPARRNGTRKKPS